VNLIHLQALALKLGWAQGLVLALAQELSKLALLAPKQQLVAVPSNVRRPHGPKPTLRLLALQPFVRHRLEELSDLAQASPEQDLQAVVVQPQVNLALKEVPQGIRPDARTS
jgi:hypothetical protein